MCLLLETYRAPLFPERETLLCSLSGREILRDMQPPHFPQRRLTPHLRPGFLIEWSEDETGTRHVGIILVVHFHGMGAKMVLERLERAVKPVSREPESVIFSVSFYWIG